MNGEWTSECLCAALERCEAETALLESAGVEDTVSRRQGINTLRALLRESEARS